MDEYVVQHDYEMSGYEARAVQHEIDHLEGLLFLDRLVSRRHDLLQRKQLSDDCQMFLTRNKLIRLLSARITSKLNLPSAIFSPRFGK